MNRNVIALDAGLSAFTIQDLCHPAGLTEVVTAKLGQLTPGHFGHDRLNQGVRQILALLRDSVCGEYRGLTLTALADFLRALDYFLRWSDRIPDTWEGGFVDDLQEVLRALAHHQEVVEDYRAWASRRGDSEGRGSRRPSPLASPCAPEPLEEMGGIEPAFTVEGHDHITLDLRSTRSR